MDRSGEKCVGRRTSDPDAGVDAEVRPHGRLAREFLPSGGSARTALLLGLARDEHSAAELSCARSIWEAALRGAMKAEDRKRSAGILPATSISHCKIRPACVA